MATPINLALYRLLVKGGASEAEAEEAARVDAADLATKDDLRRAVAELKADLLKWAAPLVFGVIGLQTAFIVFLFS